jgi:hypothetical protein
VGIQRGRALTKELSAEGRAICGCNMVAEMTGHGSGAWMFVGSKAIGMAFLQDRGGVGDGQKQDGKGNGEEERGVGQGDLYAD